MARKKTKPKKESSGKETGQKEGHEEEGRPEVFGRRWQEALDGSTLQ